MIPSKRLSVRLALRHFNGEKTEQHTPTITCIRLYLALPYPFNDWTAGVGGGRGHCSCSDITSLGYNVYIHHSLKAIYIWNISSDCF